MNFTEIYERWKEARVERRRQYQIHCVKRTWLASAVRIGPGGVRTDGGILEIPNTTRDEALEKLSNFSRSAQVMHIDDVNYIITYSI